MIKGKLPWQGLVVFDDETRMRKIAEMKCSVSAEKLTEGLSQKLGIFFKYVKKLKFNETPDYAYLSRLLHETAEEKDINIDEHCFEWVLARSFSLKSGSKSVNALGSQVEMPGKKSENSPSEANLMGSNAKFNTFNYLGIPSNGLTPKVEPDTGLASKGFNSKVVKVDSFSNINSKEEFGIIKEFEANARENLSPVSKGQKALSGRDIRTNLAPRPYSDQGDLEHDDLSENYSQDIMDENISSIGKKIAKTTLTTR